jgi:predicted phosphodiesterase
VFCASAKERVRILVTHHPLDLPGRDDDNDLAGRASMALGQLRDCMPDILLAGHLHAHEIGTTTRRFDLGGRNAIVVQAGTATSTRVRGEKNSFNLLDVDRDAVAIRRYDWNSANNMFEADAAHRYTRRGPQWMPSDAGPASAAP